MSRSPRTTRAAPPLADHIVAEDILVWPSISGQSTGRAIAPLYPRAVELPRRCPSVYQSLALVDALRVGRVRERKLALARAGHNHPLHFSARTGKANWLKPNGVGIGMRTNPAFAGLLEEIRVPLEAGDVLVFYTDGVTEAMNRASEPFGYGRLEGMLGASSHLPADGIKKELLKRLETFRQGEDFGDDVTLVVAKII